MLNLLADGAPDMGLSLLRGFENPLPRCLDDNPPAPVSDGGCSVTARCVPELQTHDPRALCGGVPSFHAGTRPVC